MIRRLTEGNTYFWLAFHVALGIAAGLNHYIVAGWLYLVILSSVFMLLKPGKNNNVLHYFFGYYVTVEIFARMLRLSPFIPVESGKYLSVFILLLGLATRPRNLKNFKVNQAGLAICLLSIPSIFLMQSEDFWSNLVFCWFGIFSLGLYVIYFSNYSFSKEEVIKLFRVIVLPLVAIASYLVFNTPSLSQLEFGITANAKASGGFGPNQVSSIFGVGIFIMAAAMIMGYQVFKNRFVDMGVLFLLIFRGILTVSRGGVFSALIALVPVYFLGNPSKSLNQTMRRLFAILVLLVGMYYMFEYVNAASGNALINRYEGKTLDVYQGNKEQDLNTLTDGRYSIISSELEIFKNHIFLGVGPGQSQRYWNLDWDENIASHTEFTRLLAEHGLPGLIICFILLFPLWRYWSERKSLLNKGFAYFLNLGFLLLGLTMCAHSSMRTSITPYFFGLSFAGMHVAAKKESVVSAAEFTPLEPQEDIQYQLN